MKKSCFFLFCSSLILLSCTGNKTNQQATATSDTAAAVKTDSVNPAFFPVTTYLKGQLLTLDTLPVTILQISTVNNKADSTWISRDKIRPLLQPFVAELIDKENLVSFFKESKFNDQSTDAITFTYDPKIALPDSIALRHWDVYVDPEQSTIRKVYLVRQLKGSGSLLTQQLTWQTGKWAKIVTIDNKAGSSRIQSDVKWVWDLSE